MTETTAPPASAGSVRVTESFSRYRFDAGAVFVRTDTPDLMEAFSDNARLAEGYDVSQGARDEIHGDLYETSLRSLPEY